MGPEGESKAGPHLPPFPAPARPAPLPPGELREVGWGTMGGNAGGSPSPSPASPGTSARRDRLLFPPLTVFLGYEMPPPATPATGPAASPSGELDGFTNPHSPEGRAGGKLAACPKA